MTELKGDVECEVSTDRLCDACDRLIIKTTWDQCNICRRFDLCYQCSGKEKALTLYEQHKQENKACIDGNLELRTFDQDQSQEPQLLGEIRTKRVDRFMRGTKPIKNDRDMYFLIQEACVHKDDAQWQQEAAMKVFEYLQSPSSVHILSLDGGGIRGYMTIKVIQYLIKECNISYDVFRSNINYFIGTSTGGLIAFCICVGYPIDDIVNIYKDGAKMFKQNCWIKGLPLFGSQYDPKPIHTQIDTILETVWKLKFPDSGSFHLKDFTMGKLQEHWIKGDRNDSRAFALTTYDCTKAQVSIFDSSFPAHENIPVHELLKSTMAAPTYFPPYKGGNDHMFVDGGMFANNPSLTGIWLARQKASSHMNCVVLSIGTGVSENDFKEDMYSGYLGWGQKGRIVNTFFDANLSYTETVIRHLPSPNIKRFRFNCRFEGTCALDDIAFPGKFDTYFEENIRKSLDMKAMVEFCKVSLLTNL